MRFTKRKLIFLLSLVAGFALACPAITQAAIEKGDRFKFINGVGSPGGIFGIQNLTNPSAPNFLTFCVEIEEFANFTSTFAVQCISLTTDLGGKTLKPYTAWLYNSFLDSTLSGFNAANVGDVNALQLAIWLGMGYTAGDVISNISNSWYTTNLAHLMNKVWRPTDLGGTAFGSSGWTGVGDIRVMNVRKVNSNGIYTDYAQDQLVRIPPNVPEPVSLVVWSLLTICACTIYNRRRLVEVDL